MYMYTWVIKSKCDYSNESYRAVLSSGNVYYAVQCFESVSIQMKASEQHFPVVLFIIVALTVKSVYEILKCAHSNESY